METQYIDQIVSEIMTDMSERQKTTGPTGGSSVPDFDDAFGDLIQDDDVASNAVMRRIWKELQVAHRLERSKQKG